MSLAGVSVVEFCEVAAGPYCAMLLADQGADVVKVEKPDGDAMRSWPPLTPTNDGADDGYSENFASVNRSKRSVVLDMKTEPGLAAAKALIARADVVIENYRPGVMAKLGIDYEAMSAVNPGVTYCSISAFGQEGPRATEGGFDLTMQAMAGVMSVTGEPGGAPVKCGVPLCDFVAGLYGAFGIASALREREQTGKGQHIDVSMLGTTLAIGALQTSEFFGTGADPRKLGSAHPRNAPYQAFRSADGHFGMAAGNNSLWERVCEVVALPELVGDQRYLTPALRAGNQDGLRETLEAVFTTQSSSHWLTAFAAVGVPSSPINSYSDALADPQVEHMGWVRDMTLPNGVQTETFGPALRVNGQSLPIQFGPPLLGQHTDEVLAELGLSL
ncbi:MAG: crotonobetainyl-CoA:carnitine CoA-transferase CaiB-like acyl-CoA transferase [Acidimicrobiales bacterium]|jgi:crotonobetainyl-CoA:carnitine CoA-transferase CaiB-like acyl-CoA transferase